MHELGFVFNGEVTLWFATASFLFMRGGWLQICNEKVWCINLDLFRFSDITRVEETCCGGSS